MNNEEQNSTKLKPCVACGEEILEFAKICKFCQTPQGWQRHLSFGQTAISLLIALFSIGTVFLTTVWSFFNPSDSELTFTGAEGLSFNLRNFGNVELSITNQGERSGFLPEQIELDIEFSIVGIEGSGNVQTIPFDSNLESRGFVSYKWVRTSPSSQIAPLESTNVEFKIAEVILDEYFASTGINGEWGFSSENQSDARLNLFRSEFTITQSDSCSISISYRSFLGKSKQLNDIPSCTGYTSDNPHQQALRILERAINEVEGLLEEDETLFN